MKKVEIEDKKGFFRDIDTNAIINNNVSALQQAKIAKEKRLKAQEEINSLKNEVSEIKETLNEILKRLK